MSQCNIFSLMLIQFTWKTISKEIPNHKRFSNEEKTLGWENDKSMKLFQPQVLHIEIVQNDVNTEYSSTPSHIHITTNHFINNKLLFRSLPLTTTCYMHFCISILFWLKICDLNANDVTNKTEKHEWVSSNNESCILKYSALFYFTWYSTLFYCFGERENAKKLNKVFSSTERRERKRERNGIKLKSVVWIFAVAEVVGRLTWRMEW